MINKKFDNDCLKPTLHELVVARGNSSYIIIAQINCDIDQTLFCIREYARQRVVRFPAINLNITRS